MKDNLVALISGLIFGLGLCISAMINPKVVIDFLDITGNWDPRLIFMMGGGLCVSGASFVFILKRKKPVYGTAFSLSAKTTLDKRLIIGSLLFGIGWGLAGICPGPAIVNLAFGLRKAYIFFLAMMVGMGFYHRAFDK